MEHYDVPSWVFGYYMRKTSLGLFEGTWGARKHIFGIIFSLESLGNNLGIIFLSFVGGTCELWSYFYFVMMCVKAMSG
ncbi:hypothetical protein HanRHA438_Chr09g0395651 [Helianthus annuus]|nr:hypothetical protein HanRHA438_Chr09g0395651 [Helianthus annuus]